MKKLIIWSAITIFVFLNIDTIIGPSAEVLFLFAKFIAFLVIFVIASVVSLLAYEIMTKYIEKIF